MPVRYGVQAMDWNADDACSSYAVGTVVGLFNGTFIGTKENSLIAFNTTGSNLLYGHCSLNTID